MLRFILILFVLRFCFTWEEFGFMSPGIWWVTGFQKFKRWRSKESSSGDSMLKFYFSGQSLNNLLFYVLFQETSQRRLANVSSMPHLSRVSSINLTMLDSKKIRGNLFTFCGCFYHLIIWHSTKFLNWRDVIIWLFF